MDPSTATQLGRELYELMQTDEGATPTAITEQPALMGLNYIRGEARHAGPLSDAEAGASARGFIEAATDSLDQPVSQREHTDADNGYAARILLALELGTDVMLLPQRRQKASAVVSLSTSGMSKRRGGGRLSWEQRLMNAVARQMIERETAFLRRVAMERQRPMVRPFSLVPAYEVLFQAIVSAGQLQPAIAGLHLYWHTPTDPNEYPDRAQFTAAELEQRRDADTISALGNYGFLLAISSASFERLTELLAALHRWRPRHDLRPVPDTPTQDVPTLPANALMQLLHCLSPWSEDQQRELIAVVRRTLDGQPNDRLQLESALAAPRYKPLKHAIDTWVQACPCQHWRGTPTPDCNVHRVVVALQQWECHMEAAWEQIGKSLASISEYAIFPPDAVLADLGIAMP